MMGKELIFSVSIRDCRVDTYRGSGKGGQKRNKTSSAVRVTHEPSGAVGQAEDGRSQAANKRLAFGRMARSEKMQNWLKIEVARRTGQIEEMKAKVEREAARAKVEIRDDAGVWVEAPHDAITP